jgi:two-component system CheB/CheR fusion protein
MRRSKKTTGKKRAGPARRGRSPAGSGRAARPTEAADPALVPAIVGLGSSAGGLDALTRFFGVLPSDSGMAFVIVAHLDPTHASLMAELLGRCTAMPVLQVEADTLVEADHVYCIPPGKYLSISGQTLRVTAPGETGSVRMPIDFFLRSLGGATAGPVIGIILSGTGSDGTIGLREIKAAGGLAIAQDPASAEHDGMPRSAIESGATDRVLSPERMPGVLIDHVRRLRAHGARSLARSVEIEPDALNELLDAVHGRTKLDLRSYKRSTLERRIGRRMGLKNVDHVADYARLLIDDPAEVAALSDDLLISVTNFFRDPEAWHFLQEHVIRPVVLRTAAQMPLRVWVPGCATGEEAYSIAMLLIEELEAARKSNPFQVFASDLDAGALDFARAGLYPESIVAEVPPERLRRFFVEENHCFRVAKRLRESVVFARQNLLTDPPFPHLDLICCRNVLMYFEAGAQKHLLSLLHFALAENGHLFLGTAESIDQEEHLFEVVSRKWRIYRRIGPTRPEGVRFPTTRAYAPGLPVVPSARRADAGRVGALALQDLIGRFVPASVLINRKHEILYFAGPTQDYLLQPTGFPTQDLMSRLRPGLEPRLRGAIRNALHAGERTVVTGARVRRGDAWHGVRVTAEPLKEPRELEGLLLVSFVDEPEAAAPLPDAPGSQRDHDAPVLRQLEDELKSMREDLQGSLEELQSSNQELRVANEEVMSVNEELRSSNEELETSKEELQSLNEELTTVNAELKDKVVELEQANNDLDNLLTSSNIATVFLDTRFHVRRFTPAATRLFDLTPAAVGRPIGEIAPRSTDPDLLHDATAVLADLSSISKEIQDRDGRWFVRQVLPYRTHDNRIEGVVITFSDVAADALQEARLYAEAIVDTVREPLLVLDADLAAQSANRSFYQTFQVTPEATVGRPLHELGDRALDVPRLRALLGDVLRQRGAVTNFEVEHEFAKLGRRTMLLNARTLTRGGGRPDLILLAIEDITDRKRAERTLHESATMTRAGVQTAVDGVITIDEHATILSFNPAAERIFGFSAPEVIGRNFGVLKAPPADDANGSLPARYLRVGEREGQGRRKDGTTFPCDLYVSEFADGSARRFVVTVRDVTERKRTEEQVRRQQGEMAHVLRVATIERFAAGLAHELNQPLTAIANDVETCATYVRSGKGGARRLLTLLDRAGAEALRAGDIVHHLRDFVKRTEPRLESADLCELLRNATRWLAREMEQEHITLHLDFAPGKLPVRVDRIQIEQVFVNLMQNAVDAIREAGKEPREIRVRAARTADGMAEVALDDTGTGVSAAAAERLYEPFFTTKLGGMGMGLAICLTIAEMHHGRMSVEPGPSGVGTTVRLLLPLEGST